MKQWLVLHGTIVAMMFISLWIFTPHLTLETPDHTLRTTNLLQPSPGIVWTDNTFSLGLDFVHQQGDERLQGLDESLGSGACAADFDGDGWVDLFLVNGSGQTRHYGKAYWWQNARGNVLFRNQQGQGFVDVTSDSGLQMTMWGMGCLSADLDNDGDVDLLVTGRDGNRLYRNEGAAHFSDVTQQSGLLQGGWSTSVAAADFDRDGLLDVYIAQFIDFQQGHKTYEANGQFSPVNGAAFDASLYPGQSNRLYRNRGGLHFQEIATETGVNDPGTRTLDVSWQDVNHDAWPDLWLTHEKGQGAAMLYLNQSGQRFTAANLHASSSLRGMATGDLNQDGMPDVLMASAMGEAPRLWQVQSDMQGNMIFRDNARALGLGQDDAVELSRWSPLVQDFDNDGDQDVLWLSGLLEADADAPRLSTGQAKRLLVNDGRGHFSDVTKISGTALSDHQSARGAVSADFDNDGDVDVYVTHNNDPGQYLQNDSPARHWLGLELIGNASNHQALGAEVRLTTAQGQQVKVVNSGEGFLSDSDKRLLFGLADQTAIQHLHIHWPGGLEQNVNIPSIDAYWRIEEGVNSPLLCQATRSITPPKLDPRIAADADLRVLRLSLLANVKGYALPRHEWLEAGTDKDARVRRMAIDSAARMPSPLGLAILLQGLEDSDTENVLAALTGLTQYEDERAMRGLLRLFAHADARVQIAVADEFAHFYREEEAMVQRKYLAIPHLLRMLDNRQPNVRRAALRALAAAERFRGVHVLLAHLNDADAQVRADVVRGLGLIRQSPALSALNTLLRDVSQPAEVVANVFIALQRSGEVDQSQQLRAYLMAQGEFTSVDSSQRCQVLRALLFHPMDSTIFNASVLQNMAHDLFASTSGMDFAQDTTLCWISIWQALPDAQGKTWLRRQSHSPHADVRLAALQGLALDSPDMAMRQAWKDSEPKIRQWALQGLLRQRHALVFSDYRHILENPLLREAALAYWSSSGFHGRSIELIRALHHQKAIASQEGLQAICLSQDEQWQAFCPVLVFAEEDAPHRALAVRILGDSSLPLKLRQAILQRYDSRFDSDANAVLYRLAQSSKDVLGDAAWKTLFTQQDPSLLALAQHIALDPTKSALTRLHAIGFLQRHEIRVEQMPLLAREKS